MIKERNASITRPAYPLLLDERLRRERSTIVRLVCRRIDEDGQFLGAVPRTEVRYRHRRSDAAVDASARCDLTQLEFVTGDVNRPIRSSTLRLSCKRRRTG